MITLKVYNEPTNVLIADYSHKDQENSFEVNDDFQHINIRLPHNETFRHEKIETMGFLNFTENSDVSKLRKIAQDINDDMHDKDAVLLENFQGTIFLELKSKVNINLTPNSFNISNWWHHQLENVFEDHYKNDTSIPQDEKEELIELESDNAEFVLIVAPLPDINASYSKLEFMSM